MDEPDDEIHFEWDPDKAARNLARPDGVSFETATYVFDDPNLMEIDDEFAKGEYRMIAIGRVENFILTVVYSEPAEGVCRIISARLATASEREAYENDLFHP